MDLPVTDAPSPPRGAPLEGPVIRLVQFPPVWGRNVSPFTLKLETWLRLAGIPFEAAHSMKLHKAPKGKLPYIVDNGVKVADSSLVIEHLKRTRGIDPDAALGPHERAAALALQRLFEDHLYFILAWSRWIDPAGWEAMAEGFFDGVPALLRGPLRPLMRRQVRRTLWLQGIARYSPEEILELAREDLEAAACHLGDKPFFMGEQLTTIDAVAYGFLANIIFVPVETDLKRLVLAYPNLVAFCETMEQGLYGDAC
ncbi:glutathione S-transferase family protein [Geminicoccaceae bacterium 1502E]|nr:glutathione S-transferase family protein [Geminicoccaceae bacterium 1502E]